MLLDSFSFKPGHCALYVKYISTEDHGHKTLRNTTLWNLSVFLRKWAKSPWDSRLGINTRQNKALGTGGFWQAQQVGLRYNESANQLCCSSADTTLHKLIWLTHLGKAGVDHQGKAEVVDNPLIKIHQCGSF